MLSRCTDKARGVSDACNGGECVEGMNVSLSLVAAVYDCRIARSSSARRAPLQCGPRIFAYFFFGFLLPDFFAVLLELGFDFFHFFAEAFFDFLPFLAGAD